MTLKVECFEIVSEGTRPREGSVSTFINRVVPTYFRSDSETGNSF